LISFPLMADSTEVCLLSLVTLMDAIMDDSKDKLNHLRKTQA
jgi:hypothetical protein